MTPQTRIEQPRPAARTSRRRIGLGALILFVVLAVVVAVVATRSSGPAKVHQRTSSSTLALAGGWGPSGTPILGQPVVADGRLLAVAAARDESPVLEAVDPANGRVTWRVPYSLSDINAGIPVTPISEAGIVLDLAPEASPTDPAVRVEGIDVGTGKTSWSEPGAAIVTDVPEMCTGQAFLCVEEVTATGSTELVLLQPSNGDVVATVSGPYRQLAFDLYETDSTPQSLEQLGASGQQEWTLPVTSVFGSAAFSPDYGWDLTPQGALDVGSVGVVPEANTVPLGDYETVGIRQATGSVAWTTPGSYQCLGAPRVTAPFVCHYSANGELSDESISVTTGSLTLEGIDPQDGAVTWSEHVADAQQLTDGSGVALAGASNVKVTLATGKAVVLDLSTGATYPVRAGALYWCSSVTEVTIVAPPAALSDGQRIGANAYLPCGSSGAATTLAPTTTPSNVGVVVDGHFIWASPEGLRALSTTK